MECNEISMLMDVKLDIFDKRRIDTLNFKAWTKCQVKIEAIKCLPCFLRITIQSVDQVAGVQQQMDEGVNELIVPIIIPGVTLSLAASRTRQYSYGIFWTQGRRNCFIYFALDTATSCRRHMKWIKKSIKNLELYRQLFLEQHRSAKGTAMRPNEARKENSTEINTNKHFILNTEFQEFSEIPVAIQNGDTNSWPHRISRASELYEEILEACDEHTLSSRISRTSVASGIYEEMTPTGSSFNAIAEEFLKITPPVPPLPPPRKRINTFETINKSKEPELPRRNTNPESEVTKKKKYKSVIENIFSNRRFKPVTNISGKQDRFIDSVLTSPSSETANILQYSSKTTIKKRSRPSLKMATRALENVKRNSFSSPDLSKINLIDSFDEEKRINLLNSFSTCDDLNLSCSSLIDVSLFPYANIEGFLNESKNANSLESSNISEQIPSNFNFSACNTSTINLIGANGAASYTTTQRNGILIDDLTGYCIMAPIIKRDNSKSKCNAISITRPKTESTSSGYSTGSYCSSTLSYTKSRNYHIQSEIKESAHKKITEESIIYENMLETSSNSSDYTMLRPYTSGDCASNLYENLLNVKAAQELEVKTATMTTSTPADSPQTEVIESPKVPTGATLHVDSEDYYQTPRKSFISVDEKISSYYPNSCDTVKMRRLVPPLLAPPIPDTNKKTRGYMGARNLVGVKMKREPGDNLNISSEQNVAEQRHSSNTSIRATLHHRTTKSHKNKKALKISANVYTVMHSNKSPSCNNDKAMSTDLTDEIKEKLQVELLQLAMLQNIDFKFDDTNDLENDKSILNQGHLNLNTMEKPFNNCNTRFLHNYVSPPKHHLQVSQTVNIKQVTNATDLIRNSAEGSSALTEDASSDVQVQWSGVKKFASLPRFKKFDFSPLKLKINNVLQRNQQQDF